MRIQTKWSEKQNWSIRICLILMFVMGVMMSIMIPPWQTPDENAHLTIIGAGIRNENLTEVLMQDMGLDNGRIRFHYEEKVNAADWRAAMTKAPSYEREEVLPRGISISIIKHLPAALGIIFGCFLGLPTFWVLTLGELFSLIFYVGICGLSIKLMPIKKELLMMIMVFPMTLQQAASINYDSVLLPLCFLYVAYIFYMRYTKERLVWRDVFAVLALLFLIFYIKLPYIFLSLLVFILPKEKIHLKIGKSEINGEVIRKWRVPAGILILLLLILGVYLLRDNFWVQLVGGMVCEWKHSIYLFAATAYHYGVDIMVSSVGQFGWLEAALPLVFVIITYVLLLVLAVVGEEKNNLWQLQGKTRGYLWLVAVILALFTVTAMVNHTITILLYGYETTAIDYNVREGLRSISYIGGLQGRYFLPFLALPFIALPSRGSTKNWKIWVVPVYAIVAAIITAAVLYNRYWTG